MSYFMFGVFLLLCYIHFPSSFACIIDKTTSKETSSVKGTASFLWIIEANPPSYLFGTMHVPYVLVLDAIPDIVMEAFNNSQKFYSEVNNDIPENGAEDSCGLLLPNNQMVSDILPTNVYDKLQSYIEYLKDKIVSWQMDNKNTKRLSPDNIRKKLFPNWKRTKIVWLFYSIFNVERSGISAEKYPILDDYLHELAKKQGKSVGGIETANDQCDIVNNLNVSHIIFWISDILKYEHDEILARVTQEMNEEISDFRNGIHTGEVTIEFTEYDNKQSQQIGEEYHSYMRNSMVERNKNMAKRIINLIINEPKTSFFFAFGVSHFIGEESVVDIMRQTGIQVKRIDKKTFKWTENYSSGARLVYSNLCFVCLCFIFYALSSCIISK